MSSHNKGISQTAPPAKNHQVPQELLPAPQKLIPVPYGTSQNIASEKPVPVNLATALRLAQTSNLDILQAREAVNQSQARLDKANASILPNFNIGSTYLRHDGNIQKTEGNIIKANKDSLFVGGGPSLVLPTVEALFTPLAARQLAAASEAGFQRVQNETLFSVADAYLNVLRARRRVARIQETLEQLLNEKPTDLRGQSKGLLPLIRDFVERGAKEAFPADLERVRVEVMRRQEELVGAVNEYQIANAELARLLRLDPALPLEPTEDIRVPLFLPGEEWMEKPIDQLVEVALNNRPEIGENRALVEATLARVRAANFRPMLPNVVLNYSWGDFGGDPDLKPRGGFGPSGTIRHFAPRSDFEASLIWRWENLGFGNRAEQREQQALHRSTVLRQSQVQDRVVAQVIQAYELVAGWRERWIITRSALFDEKGEPAGPVFRSMRLNFERIRGWEGRPLEVLDSIRGLSDMMEAFGQAVTDYERARFRLLIALGLPPRDWINSQSLPQTPKATILGCTQNP
ncbi:MAG TPA: TolC family protein [Gemmataceae bacterium]|nr:TolC family protein [Gemmataceae bacterium]